MAKVIITVALQEEIHRTFKTLSIEIFLKMKALEDTPQRGKAVVHVAEIVIKELKYGKYRFYCITDGRILKFGTHDELATLLIKFVRMSEKKDQQQIINNIKDVLRLMGFDAW